MFYSASAFNQDIGDWNTAQVTTMQYMFGSAFAFNQDIGGWDTSQVTNMQWMFYSASTFNRYINSWIGPAAFSPQTSLFYNATAFQAKFTCDDAVLGPIFSCSLTPSTPIPSESWRAFVAECLAEEPVTGECTMWASQNDYGTMPYWDTSLVTDMSGWSGANAVGFRERSTFNGDISKWKTSSVTTMAYMFYEAYAFNQPIGGWDTSNVASMRAMFLSASAFNQDIGKWDTSKVTNMRAMFYEVPAFNRDVRRWYTVQVTDMSWMFYHANAFNSDISHWVGPATETAQAYMFAGSTSFQAKYECTDVDHGPSKSCANSGRYKLAYFRQGLFG